MARYRTNNPCRYLLALARSRANKSGISFSITEKDIVIGKRCPVLGILFKRGKNRKAENSSPTLDRIIPRKGYVPGNVVVISHLANTIKNSADWKQVMRVGKWLKRVSYRKKTR